MFVVFIILCACVYVYMYLTNTGCCNFKMPTDEPPLASWALRIPQDICKSRLYKEYHDAKKLMGTEMHRRNALFFM